MILATHGIIGSSIGQIPQVSDADAQAFVNRVYTAGGTLSTTELIAINTLVIDLKGYSIWTKMKAIYPMIGSSGTACAQNLKSSSFTGTFFGGWTFASTGAKPNGTTGYMDTTINMFNEFSINNVHLSYYSRTQNANSIDVAMATFTALGDIIMTPKLGVGFGFYSAIGGLNAANIANTDCRGFWLGSRIASNDLKGYKNGSQIVQNTTNATNTLPSNNLVLAGQKGTSVRNFSLLECAFSSVGEGLTSSETSNLNTVVQAFQTTLSRQV
jgi:hypothetical protein